MSNVIWWQNISVSSLVIPSKHWFRIEKIQKKMYSIYSSRFAINSLQIIPLFIFSSRNIGGSKSQHWWLLSSVVGQHLYVYALKIELLRRAAPGWFAQKKKNENIPVTKTSKCITPTVSTRPRDGYIILMRPFPTKFSSLRSHSSFVVLENIHSARKNEKLRREILMRNKVCYVEVGIHSNCTTKIPTIHANVSKYIEKKIMITIMIRNDNNNYIYRKNNNNNHWWCFCTCGLVWCLYDK